MRVDDVLDVVGLLRIFGNERSSSDSSRRSGEIAGGAPRGGIVEIVGRQEAEQLADHGQAIGVVAGNEMRDAAVVVVGHGAAQFLLGDFFVRDGLDHVGPGDEHVGSVARHENKIGDRRRIHGAACARPHDGADLRNHAAGKRVAQKNIGITGQRSHAFLNARAAGIVEANHRRAVAHGQVHDLADFRALASESEPPKTVKSCAKT